MYAFVVVAVGDCKYGFFCNDNTSTIIIVYIQASCSNVCRQKTATELLHFSERLFTSYTQIPVSQLPVPSL